MDKNQFQQTAPQELFITDTVSLNRLHEEIKRRFNLSAFTCCVARTGLDWDNIVPPSAVFPQAIDLVLKAANQRGKIESLLSAMRKANRAFNFQP